MVEVSKEIGILVAVADRLVKFDLPLATEIQRRVDEGEVLTDSDVSFLRKVLRDARSLESLTEKHPEYQEIIQNAIGLYSEILGEALSNEQEPEA